MTRTPLIAGNWKMNTNLAEAEQLAAATARAAADLLDRDVMIAPPFTAIAQVADLLHDSRVILAAQNICWAEKGAFTGEISPPMLKELGVSMAIVGHSERRHIFGESDALINRRVTGAMEHQLVPVLCIGETLDERESERTKAVLEKQLRAGLVEITVNDPAALVLAYEPVWAIGTGKTAAPAEAQEIHAFIRKLLAAMFEKDIASQIRILYGGSVVPDNIDALMGQEDVDGALVGGAALKAESFERIIHFNG
ncbi:MAG: triose-phosphate isomerase [Desulfurivibrionaceae bacterium]|nr:triose-phosphate isomerase [Desulfobulbales bacterium]MDT8334325.1 triose-phosphate isomerase [Desulfurivibrionaceae bacterium]